MPKCEVCHGTEFTEHDGFYYCMECQTQSQDVWVQVAEATVGDTVLRKSAGKSQQKKKKKKKRNIDDGNGSAEDVVEEPIQKWWPPWTSWEAFNCILLGMVRELVALGAPPEVEGVALQLWACHLSVSNVAFTSFEHPELPKLSYPYRHRDVKILYGLDREHRFDDYRRGTHPFQKRRARSKKSRSSASSSANLSIIAHKSRLRQEEYESSATELSSDDMTLESLSGREEARAPRDKEPRIRKRHMTEEGYRLHRTFEKNVASRCRAGFNHSREFTRGSLLAVLAIALRLCDSSIHLSHLFRFISEGQLSYTNVSHLLPSDIKFYAFDEQYINAKDDLSVLPYSGVWEKVRRLAAMFRLHHMPLPHLGRLLREYTHQLMLPDAIPALAEKLLFYFPGIHDASSWFCYEGAVVASLLVLMKMLFGLDQLTEYRTSHLARTINRFVARDEKVFDLTHWQCLTQAFEARSIESSYSAQEQLMPEATLPADLAAQFMEATFRDRNDRFWREEDSGYKRHSRSVSLKWMEILKRPDSATHPVRSKVEQEIRQDLEEEFGSWSSLDVSYLLNIEKFRSLLEMNGVQICFYDSWRWLEKYVSKKENEPSVFDDISKEDLDRKIPISLDETPMRKMGRSRHTDSFCPPRELNDDSIVWVRSDRSYWTNRAARARAYGKPERSHRSSHWDWLLRRCSAVLRIDPSDLAYFVRELENGLLENNVT